MRRCLTSLASMELQMKTTMRYYFVSAIRWITEWLELPQWLTGKGPA